MILNLILAAAFGFSLGALGGYAILSRELRPSFEEHDSKTTNIASTLNILPNMLRDLTAQVFSLAERVDEMLDAEDELACRPEPR